LGSTEAELTAHPDNLAVAKLNLEELGTGKELPVLILQQRDALLGSSIVDVRRVAPGILAIETETNPAVPSSHERDILLGLGRHLRRFKNEELLALLITDPEFGFIRVKPRGCVAQYPTKVPFHYASRHLRPGQDLFGEVPRCSTHIRSGSSSGSTTSLPSTTAFDFLMVLVLFC
jgi:hypothetical protein